LTILVALQSIRVTDAQDNEVLSVNVQNGGSNRVTATNESKRPIEFIQVQHFPMLTLTDFRAQDPERIASETLDILLKLKRVDDLTLHFKGQVMGGQSNGQTEGKPTVTGLTFIHTTTQKDAKRLLTTDFNADPNVCVFILQSLIS
jgi:hypothetical protein